MTYPKSIGFSYPRFDKCLSAGGVFFRDVGISDLARLGESWVWLGVEKQPNSDFGFRGLLGSVLGRQRKTLESIAWQLKDGIGSRGGCRAVIRGVETSGTFLGQSRRFTP